MDLPPELFYQRANQFVGPTASDSRELKKTLTARFSSDTKFSVRIKGVRFAVVVKAHPHNLVSLGMVIASITDDTPTSFPEQLQLSQSLLFSREAKRVVRFVEAQAKPYDADVAVDPALWREHLKHCYRELGVVPDLQGKR